MVDRDAQVWNKVSSLETQVQAATTAASTPILRTGSALPDYPVVLSSALPLPANGQGFRLWHYATFHAALRDGGELLEITADSGCTATSIGKEFLQDNANAVIRPMDKPVTLRGILKDTIECIDMATITMWIPGVIQGKQSTAEITFEARVVPGLRAGLLIGSDVLGTHRMVIDYNERKLKVAACLGLEASLRVLARDHARIKRVVTSRNPVTVPPRSLVNVPVSVRDRGRLPSNRDYCFTPEWRSSSQEAGLYSHIVDADINFVLMYNDSEVPIQLPRKTRLGHLHDCTEDGAY